MAHPAVALRSPVEDIVEGDADRFRAHTRNAIEVAWGAIEHAYPEFDGDGATRERIVEMLRFLILQTLRNFPVVSNSLRARLESVLQILRGARPEAFDELREDAIRLLGGLRTLALLRLKALAATSIIKQLRDSVPLYCKNKRACERLRVEADSLKQWSNEQTRTRDVLEEEVLPPLEELSVFSAGFYYEVPVL